MSGRPLPAALPLPALPLPAGQRELVRRIDARLAELGTSAREACRRSGLEISRIARIRRGYEPKVSTLVRPAHGLGLAPGTLIEALAGERLFPAGEPSSQGSPGQ